MIDDMMILCYKVSPPFFKSSFNFQLDEEPVDFIKSGISGLEKWSLALLSGAITSLNNI